MEKVLGIDLGTNSIGLALRNNNELDWFGVYTFKKGVGQDKTGEYSFAAERTKHRSSRRLYNARRYRKWETLKVLIEDDFCPLSIEGLKNWKHYTKENGRQYPIQDELFQNWIKLDFNNDGKPDYTSPYQLRRELIQGSLDVTNCINRYRIGRAFYHIAQRRGFKSSRKAGSNEKAAIYKGSNETKTIGRDEYEQLINDAGSLGAAFAQLEDQGTRIRNRYTLRKDYQDEVEKILEIQEIDDNEFKESIIKAIFFQRPLRSQKGLVGKCTLEPSKHRCPVSHPKFEMYRAWSFINNIKFKNTETQKWEQLPKHIQDSIFENVFMRLKSSFPFGDIRKHIKKVGSINYELNYKEKADKVSVAGCPVCARFKSVFGENWQQVTIQAEKHNKQGDVVTRTYSIDDLWHVLFSFEDEECFHEFVVDTLQLTDDQAKGLITLWNSFPVGYANLSLKAINTILPMLELGLIYTEAVLLAKVPEIIGAELFEENRELLIRELKAEIAGNRFEKSIIDITNNLIAKYYLLDYSDRFAWKDFTYQLEDSDKDDVLKCCIEHFGKNRWDKKADENKGKILGAVAEQYQLFFKDERREHLKQPRLSDRLKDWLLTQFSEVPEEDLEKLYHPSQIDIYPGEEDQELLKSPKTGAFKNPMAYKTLHVLRKVLNNLIEIGKINRETRVVVEVAREMNDSNKRWAIETYQRRRENQNMEFAIAIKGLLSDKDFIGEADPNNETDRDKFRLWFDQLEDCEEVLKDINAAKTDIDKYRLWKEQNCLCMYTGDTINLTDLFAKNKVDFEHTIPRSKSFDNSLKNLTVCYADYNRHIKKNKIPTELPNYHTNTTEGTAIKPRLDGWKKKVEELDKQVKDWQFNSKIAMDKDRKDYCIRQKHLRSFEYEYWKEKLDRFTRKDVPSGFKHSQITDTQIISKYAFHYLKTVFNKVDVQKGTVTAEFRKIYGIQPKDEKKSRDKHHHHAMDAAVLTLIPPSSKRQDILRKAFEYEEETRKQYTEVPFKGFKASDILDIENTILINNVANKDQALSPGKKVIRKRGRVVWLKNKHGKYIEDENGKKIPKISQGDSIRGQLHQETFYGKIKVVKRDDNGKPLRDDEKEWLYESKDDGFKFVVRRPIESITKLDQIVDPDIVRMIELQLDGKSLKQKLAEGVWMLDKKGNKVNRIRRVRCWVRSSNLLQIKEQTYKSKHSYKNYYYADTGDNYAFALYQDKNGKRKIVSRNLFDISTFSGMTRIEDKAELFEKTIELGKGKNKTEATLFHIFQVGQKVLFYENNREELADVDNLSNRLYYVRLLFDAKQGLMQFQHHLEARNDERLLKDFPKDTFGAKGKNGFSSYSTDFIQPRLLLSPGNLNCIIEGRDFEMILDGEIKFLFK